MTAADRQRVRDAVDARVRELVADMQIPTCAECGAEYSSQTAGCKRCWDRARGRRRYVAA